MVKVNQKHGRGITIYVDAPSIGFIASFLDSKLRWNFSYLIMENELMSVNTNLGFYTQLSGKLCGVRKIGRWSLLI